MFKVHKYDRDNPIEHNEAEFDAPSFCPACGTELDHAQEYWWSKDDTMLMAECPSCHTHFGVCGHY